MGDSTVGAEEEAKEEKDKSGKAKGKGERRRTRRGGRRNPQKERKLTTKDTGLRSLLVDRRPPGPPTPSVFMRLLEELAKLDVGGKNKKIIEEEIGRLESAGEDAPNQLLRTVTMCKFESCYDQDQVKLVIAMNELPSRSAVLDSLVQIGLTYKQGPAPAGYLEEEVSSRIEAIEESLA